MRNIILLKKITLSLLALVTILWLVTGFGITQYRIVEPLTFGLLTKNLSFRMHNSLTVPSLVILAVALRGRC